ncbi:hypothetical protein G5714_022354 [Onychostoma macrolepis]|uniref:Uncharacterized protein n=1 Tax=Onychostoma macrolepis TaxID=369639 RepID=A0A7J6BQ28_9TELE|nr:hypothetical protein G5714_022354 [Onychostoma macrolepis]
MRLKKSSSRNAWMIAQASEFVKAKFEEGILPACMFVLEKSCTPGSGWGNPINISRVVSDMVIANKDCGVLAGNWSNCYGDGTAPTSWCSSGQVNNDKVYWQKKSNGTFGVVHVEKDVVGHCISTKAVGSDQRIDITNLYKHPLGYSEKCTALETAVRHGSKRCAYPLPCAEDVVCEVSLKGDGPCVGKDAVLYINLKNKCSSHRSITFYSQAAAMYYTGVRKTFLKRDQTCIELKPSECEK